MKPYANSSVSYRNRYRRKANRFYASAVAKSSYIGHGFIHRSRPIYRESVIGFKLADSASRKTRGAYVDYNAIKFIFAVLPSSAGRKGIDSS